MELKKTALHDKHVALGAKMVPFAGYNMPVRYSSDIEEHKTVREGVGVFDVSHMGEFMVRGSEAALLIQLVTTNDISKLKIGQAQYSCMTNLEGGIVDDLIVYKLADEEFMLVVNASNIEKDWNWISQYAKGDVMLENISDNLSLFAVQGPKAIEALQSLTPVKLADIPFYHFVKGEFAGVPDVIISGTGYTGSGGFELYVPNQTAGQVWDRIFEAGQPYNIKPIGLGARDTLRLEMGYCLYGNDIDDTTSPLEARLGWITKFSKEFNNAENLRKQKESGVERQLSGFKMIDRGIPRQGYELVDADGNKIGVVTSGTMSPSLSQGIGMGYLKKEYSQPGTEIFVDIRGRRIKAEVVKLPFYQN
ncbi:glycine cleavage system aminomethyltransferase T [Flammeovirgaceae bacterium 311]|nr:glycine cleavage system aminomethyltransferase T [Flammeovirgaceae bacterium 311]